VSIRRAITYLLFYPTLLWNVVLSILVPSRRWFDEVDDWVLLGALPTHGLVRRFKEMGVGAVVNMCTETSGPVRLYDELDIEYLRLLTTDFFLRISDR
jgi:atypical dual specificity phosphatase